MGQTGFMSPTAPERLSFDDALAWEENSFERHEFILGHLKRRQGRPPSECDVIMNLIVAFGTRAQNTRYRCLNSEMHLRIGDEPEWFYPTLFLYEPPLRFHPRDDKGFVNPRLIVEVFSRETPVRERAMRLYRYQRIPDLSDYVMVRADELFVKRYQRLEDDRWARHLYIGRDAHLQLDNFGISVPLSEIYEDIELAEQPVLPFDDEPNLP